MFLGVLPRVLGNKGALFLSVASRPAINNVLSILSTVEIKCQEGCSRGQMRVQTGVFFGKERVCLIVGIIFLNWAATQRSPHKGCTKSAPRYATVEYYIRGADIRHPLSRQRLSRTHDARLLLTALSGRSGQEWNAQFACLAPKHAGEIFSP